MQVEFKFGIGQAVKIKANGLKGEVRGAWLDIDCKKSALVCYVLTSGEIQDGWFRDHELEACGLADVVVPPPPPAPPRNETTADGPSP